MTKISALVFAGALALTLTACGGGGGTDEGGSDGSVVDEDGNAAGYIVDVPELDANVYPENYPLIPADEFEAAYDTMLDKNVNMELETYQDIVDIFGVDGAYYVNNDYDAGGVIFKYYGWYSDNGGTVLFTFKAEGDALTYYAYTSQGI